MTSLRIPLRAVVLGFLILPFILLDAAPRALAEESIPASLIPQLDAAIKSRDSAEVARICQDLDDAGVETFRTMVEALPHSPFRDDLLGLVVKELARVDGEFACQYALSLDSLLRQKYADMALQIWASNSPDQAWEAFLKLSNFGSDRMFRAERLIAGVAMKDVDKAITFFNELSNEIDCVGCSAGAIVFQIFRNGEEASLARYESRIADPFKLEQWMENKWDIWGYYNPSVGLENLKQTVAQSEQTRALINLYSGWSRYRPRECIERLASDESEELFAAAFPHIINEWGKYSLLDESLELIKSIDRDTITDRAIVGISSRLATLDPEYSWELVSSIEDNILRQTGIKNFVWSVSKSEPDYLRKLADETSTPEIRDDLLWYFLQYMPANGHFDIANDMRFFLLLSTESKSREALAILVSASVNVSSTTSSRIDLAKLAAAISELQWIGEADKSRYISLLQPAN